ncbi:MULTISPECIES: branched-chain amino acid ABC transporter permease [Nocardioides]|uniref:Branched-chain amino acid ABC transporter permease n=1 Tax=Nocardioides vastitatis TaxID=2568655 RepID=A0ABW0ZEC6_9ACTN|nr:branched-chain amino acid ABC transporter permease [Nocardioides sp.]THJ04307.1 branched-chain amino acid ABC transporter permease [Nocardioides sp.]
MLQIKLVRHGLLTLAAAAVVALLVLQSEDVSNFEYIQVAAYVCAAAGLTLLIGVNGQLSLGHAALMAVGAYSAALYLRSGSEDSLASAGDLFVALLVGSVTAAVVGIAVGAVAARLRGPYLAGATLALGACVVGVTTYFDHLLGGDQGLTMPLTEVPAPLSAALTSYQWSALVSLGTALLVLFLLTNLKYSPVGREMAAVRDHEVAAQLCGLSVARVQINTFVVSSAAAGAGGAILGVLYLQIASPGAFTLFLSIYLLAAVVIGGLGSMRGAVIGTVIVLYFGRLIEDRVAHLGLSTAQTDRLAAHLPLAAFGVLLIVVMLAVPGGIQGTLGRIAPRLLQLMETVGGKK